MKVYSCPTEVPVPEVDYANFDNEKVQADEAQHSADLAKWLKKNGFNGKNTGKILYEPFADGYAQYMVAEGRSFALVHLPYGDAWSSPNVKFFTKAEVLRRINGREEFRRLFAKA